LEQVAADGKLRKMKLYSLDILSSVYNVKSKIATQYLKDYFSNYRISA